MANWLNSFLFAAAWESRKQEKAKRELEEFLNDRRKEMSAAITALSETISDLFDSCGTIDFDPDFAQDMRLAMFYAFGEVLSAQGEVLPEQESVLKLYISKLQPPYNYSQLTNAAIHRTGIYQEYKNKVGLSQDFCGSFWLKVFEMIYRTRLVDTLQEIDNHLSSIVINFAYLGDPNNTIAKPICDQILNSLNYHVDVYQQTPYIHALMLLQNMLLEKCDLPIEDHCFVRVEDCEQNGRNYFVFLVLEKEADTVRGKFAVREIKVINGKLDFQNDGDQILLWNDAVDKYEVFYQECT